MKISRFDIEYKYGETIKIKPIFDVHLGNRYCDVKALKAYLSEYDDSTYFFGGGDLLESIVVTDPRYEKHADGTQRNDIIDEQRERAEALLEPIKDRLIGLGIGNHEQKIVKHCSHNPINILCKTFGCEPLGYSGLIKLVLTENGSRGRSVVIRYHHGWGGGGRTAGASLTKYEKDLKNWDADIFLYGHDHQKKGDRIPRLGLSGNKLISKPMLLGVCGAYLKTYSDSADPSYSELAGYPPVELGGITINIKPINDWVRLWIDV